MKIAYLDCFSGISGDMLLGAFIDIGLPLEQLKSGLSSLGLDEYDLVVSKTEKCGIFGTKFDVVFSEGHQHHRHLPDIVEMIERSSLDEKVKSNAVKVFERLAEAEGKVHNVPAEKIHFHEVGAVDSIIDVVGSVLAIKLLDIEKIYCSPLPMGRGFVKVAHGMMPLPAPATAELLKEIPVYWVDSDKELVTPTGAAIVSTLADTSAHFPPVRWEQIGYGCGNYSREVPNMLRIFTGWSL
jgi:hypothetical protein